ncbi:MAG TPA: helix-turn-helix transcriptional regulator [Terracidiphilus sp.]|nr:helix-turn-helix transcriptional regulator [Terracidiphilus sp.]
MADLLGTFEQSVLLSILGLGEEAYGRAILNGVQESLQREVSAGAVYSTLERLEASGLVTSKLAAGTAVRGGRARRYYTVAATGRRALSETRRALTAIWSNVKLPAEERS